MGRFVIQGSRKFRKVSIIIQRKLPPAVSTAGAFFVGSASEQFVEIGFMKPVESGSSVGGSGRVAAAEEVLYQVADFLLTERGACFHRMLPGQGA